MKNKTLRLISAALLLLFISHQSITIFYTHAHNIRGAMIVHSHPFDKTSDTEHTHTLYDLQLIQSGMTNLVLFILAGLFLRIFTRRLKQVFPESVDGILTRIHNVFHHRGPPVVAVI